MSKDVIILNLWNLLSTRLIPKPTSALAIETDIKLVVTLRDNHNYEFMGDKALEVHNVIFRALQEGKTFVMINLGGEAQ